MKSGNPLDENVLNFTTVVEMILVLPGLDWLPAVVLGSGPGHFAMLFKDSCLTVLKPDRYKPLKDEQREMHI